VEPTAAPTLPSWWLEEARRWEGEARDATPLEGEHEVDVAIVGAGYTGLWTALAVRQREPSARVLVLEAETVGEGPSGRNGGFLHGYWTDLARLRTAFGDDGALEVARGAAKIVPGVRSWCEAHGADVWFREGGLLRVSAAPAQDAALAKPVEAAQALGVADEAVQLSATELAQRIRSPRFRAGVFFRDCATVQPARLARALRRVALESGIELHERTPMLRLRAGDPSVLTLPHARVRAREVVMAVNAAATGWRPLAGALTNFGSYVVLTEPIPDLLEEIGWTGGEAVVDGRMFLHYFRATPDGRVLMGSGSGAVGYGGRIDGRFSADAGAAARAEKGLRELLPALAGARVERAWGGPIDVSADHLPFFGTLPNARVHYGAGYSGHGVGPSWLGGQILASLVTGREDEWTALPLARRRLPKLPPEPFRYLGGRAIRAAIMATEEAEEAGRRAPLPVRALADVPARIGLRVGVR
jgi:glycine/D-amino acid oxidase-like deaminating enzyme